MRRTISRREFAAGAAALGAGAVMAAGGAAQEKKIDISFKKDFKAPDKCFMDQYYDGMMKIAQDIRNTQVENIAKAMEKAFELRQKGGRIYSHVLLGHFAMFTGSPDLPGQPNLLPQRVDRREREDFAAMKKGDFLITIARTMSRATNVNQRCGSNGLPYWKTSATGKAPVFNAIGITARSRIGS